MTDTTGTNRDNAPAPGWWKASDGNWYPPQGQAPPPPPGAHNQPQNPTNGLAIASMVTGIIAAVLFWAFGLSAIIGIVAVVLGFVGLSKSKNLPGRVGRGQAITGIVTGIVGIVAAFFILVGIAALGSSAEDQFRQVGTELESIDGGVNSDPANGWCNEDRYYQDPDC